MRHTNRDKAREEEEEEEDMYYSTSSFGSCRLHPSASSVGICSQCLKERLVRLVCSDCGEQRLSSCSCSSEISSTRNSDVGAIGRVSFLIDSDALSIPPRRTDFFAPPEPKRPVSTATGLRGLSRIFGRRRRKKGGAREDSGEEFRNAGAVSRSRSLCSFRNGFGTDDGGAGAGVGGGARSSISGARNSSVTICGGMLDSGRRSGFSEVEPRKSDHETFSSSVSEFSGFVGNGGGNRRVFSLRESDFGGMDDSRFIDLKLDFSAESKAGFVSESETGFGSMRSGSESFGVDHYNGGVSRGGSCRITSHDKGVKKGSAKSSKAWRWIFRNHTARSNNADL